MDDKPPSEFPVIVSVVEKPDCSAILQEISNAREILDPEYYRILRLVNAIADESKTSKSTKSLITSKHLATTPKHAPKRHYFTNLEAQQPYVWPPQEYAPEQPKDEVQFVLRDSNWYKNLSATHKMLVDHQLAMISNELNRFHSISAADKRLDLTFVMQNFMLQQVLSNLGFYISDAGMLEQLPQMLRASRSLQQPDVARSFPPFDMPNTLRFVRTTASERPQSTFEGASEQSTALPQRVDSDASLTIGNYDAEGTNAERLSGKDVASADGSSGINLTFPDIPPRRKSTQIQRIYRTDYYEARRLEDKNEIILFKS